MTETERMLTDQLLASRAELDREREHRIAETQRADLERARRLVAESEVSRLLAIDDSPDLRTIDQRDRAQDVIAEAAAILGCRQEWSSCHDHHHCVVGLAHESVAQRSRLHRRAQRAESQSAAWKRQAMRSFHEATARLSLICDAWDALPEHIRHDIAFLDGEEVYGMRDLVRGVRMLVDESRRCDSCGHVGEVDARCGACVGKVVVR